MVVMARFLSLRRIFGDQAGPAPVGREADQPSDEDQYAVLEADEVPEVDGEPDDPREKPTESKAFDVGHRAGTADGGQVALVVVAERLGRPSVQPVPHDPRR